MVLKLVLIILGFILFVYISLKISNYYEVWHRKIMDKHENKSVEEEKKNSASKNL